MWWEIALGANLVITLAYFGISYAILAPLVREGQLRANRLGAATAGIFFTCAVGHGMHGLHPLLLTFGDHSALAKSGRIVSPNEVIWEVATALVAVYYWTLRRTYGALMRGAALFADLEQERLARELESRQALAEARDLFSGVLDAATQSSIIGTDLSGRVTVFNVGAERLLGYAASDLLGKVPDQLHDDAELADLAAKLGMPASSTVLVQALAQGESDTRQWTYLTKTGRRLTMMLTVTAMHNEAGAITGHITVGTDVTEQRKNERALAESEARFRLAFDTAPVGMAMIDLDVSGSLLRVNHAMCALTGRTEQQLCVLDLDAISHPDDAEAGGAMIERLRSGEDATFEVEKRFLRPDGSIVWGQVAISVVAASLDRDAYGICLVEDITARKQAEAALVHQSLHDPLTGLANRTLLHNRIEHALAATTRSGTPVGVLYLDLDGFKLVNDTSGHAAGDELLAQVAARIQPLVRPEDTVARIGGDEFAVVCVGLNDFEGLNAAAKRVLATLTEPFNLRSGTHMISASIGIAMSDRSTTAEDLLNEADAAMYTAKKGGKNRIATPQLMGAARASRTMRLLPQLQDAVNREQLIMYGQPVIDLATGCAVAVETLIRWDHPTRGILTPAEFLDVAEHSPLMVAIGQRALAESCRMAAHWVGQFGDCAPDLHVNVSGRQLESGHVSDDVLRALSESGLTAEKLVLELTETHMPTITDSLRRDLHKLRDLGVRIAIDDLGTGYSSLTRITELPVDVLKIDLSFIAFLGQDNACDGVVRAILSLGQAMGLSVIAEGVETAVQAELLRSYGCETVQGYLYSRPLPELALPRYLADHRSATPIPVNSTRIPRPFHQLLDRKR